MVLKHFNVNGNLIQLIKNVLSTVRHELKGGLDNKIIKKCTIFNM